jgi:hypothetical protein
MPRNSLRFVIPKTIGGMLKLAGLIYSKHLQDGANSPLNSLSDYNWNEHGPNVQRAAEKHAEAEELTRRAEHCYRERNFLMGDVNGLVLSSRDLLKGIFKKTPKKPGEWGFEVNDTPRVGKVK